MNKENLGMDQEEAKDTLPSINLRALNRQEKASEKLSSWLFKLQRYWTL